MMKKIGYGLILWAVCYISAIPLMPLMQTDPTFFKTIMIVEGTVLGSILMALYFNGVNKDYLKEGIWLGVIWLVVNWGMDFIALLPLSKMPVDRYFIEIGLRHIGMLSPTVAIGYLLERKLKV